MYVQYAAAKYYYTAPMVYWSSQQDAIGHYLEHGIDIFEYATLLQSLHVHKRYWHGTSRLKFLVHLIY